MANVQATATEELFTATKDGNMEFVKECIANGAYPNKFKDPVKILLFFVYHLLDISFCL